MKNPITPEGAASVQKPLPPVPTTKILAISHFMGAPMTPAQRAQIMPHEVHDTVPLENLEVSEGRGIILLS